MSLFRLPSIFLLFDLPFVFIFFGLLKCVASIGCHQIACEINVLTWPYLNDENKKKKRIKSCSPLKFTQFTAPEKHQQTERKAITNNAFRLDISLMSFDFYKWYFYLCGNAVECSQPITWNHAHSDTLTHDQKHCNIDTQLRMFNMARWRNRNIGTQWIEDRMEPISIPCYTISHNRIEEIHKHWKHIGKL